MESVSKSCFERALLVQKKCYYIFKNAVSLNFNPNPRRALRIETQNQVHRTPAKSTQLYSPDLDYVHKDRPPTPPLSWH